MGRLYEPNSRKIKLIKDIKKQIGLAKENRNYYLIDQLKNRLKLAKRV
jgi:hypothetical protein